MCLGISVFRLKRQVFNEFLIVCLLSSENVLTSFLSFAEFNLALFYLTIVEACECSDEFLLRVLSDVVNVFLKIFIRRDVSWMFAWTLYLKDFGQVFLSAWALSFSTDSSHFLILVSKAVAPSLNRDRLLGLYCSLGSYIVLSN